MGPGITYPAYISGFAAKAGSEWRSYKIEA